MRKTLSQHTQLLSKRVELVTGVSLRQSFINYDAETKPKNASLFNTGLPNEKMR